MAPPSLALVFLALVFHFLNVLGAPAGKVESGDKGEDVDVNSPRFEINMNIDMRTDPMTNKVFVSGRGVKDSYELESRNHISSPLTSISNEKFALYNNTEQDLAFFTDTDAILVVFKDNKCTKRSYKTSRSKTTYTESKMRPSQCEEVKDKMKKAEEQWVKEFNEEMKTKFPPCFPFCGSKDPNGGESQDDKHKESSEDESKTSAEDSLESADSSSEEITETDKTSPEYWRQWQKKFDANMKKKFPPCFPFCDKKKQSDKKKQGDKKKQTDKDKSQSTGSQSSKPSKGSQGHDADEDDIDEWNF